ncbi:MAG: hypothetical protein H7A21_01035 [Spirochaetales bacterium]|nr:hypothetical protein [Leptospiraceae bacterium]MCP5479992.1 hypothetical protein [Spirochaetales bacterium]MCP5486622.1 hypothetical protein [Spirochaetales bacterium]
MEDYLEEVSDIQAFRAGDIVRRIGKQKDQQGGYRSLTEDGSGLIVVEVLDLAQEAFVAEAGIIRPEADQRIYRHKSRFDEDQRAQDAMEILLSWTLFREHAALQGAMVQFVQTAYSPAQILKWKKDDRLRSLFVPVQQRFKIGRFKEKVDLDLLRRERFREQLQALHSGKHMTYVAFIPRDTNNEPMFFSIGTKPHLETKKVLEREQYAFHPNHGGHIKCLADDPEKPKLLLVDAGSNDLGAGMHAPLATAEMIVEALKEAYPEFEYEAVEGRGAFGIQQSY